MNAVASSERPSVFLVLLYRFRYWKFRNEARKSDALVKSWLKSIQLDEGVGGNECTAGVYQAETQNGDQFSSHTEYGSKYDQVLGNVTSLSRGKAVLRIQTFFRMYAARKRYLTNRTRWILVRQVTLVQSIFRMRAAMERVQTLSESRLATNLICASVKRYSSMKALSLIATRAHLTGHATRIQRAYRSYRFRQRLMNVGALRLLQISLLLWHRKRCAAVTVIASFCRMRRVQKRCATIVLAVKNVRTSNLKKAAVTTIATHWRGFVARRYVDSFFRTVLICQSVSRMRLMRGAYEELKTSVARISCWWLRLEKSVKAKESAGAALGLSTESVHASQELTRFVSDYAIDFDEKDSDLPELTCGCENSPEVADSRGTLGGLSSFGQSLFKSQISIYLLRAPAEIIKEDLLSFRDASYLAFWTDGTFLTVSSSGNELIVNGHRKIQVPMSARITKFASGTNHAVFSTSSGHVYTLGSNDYCQCGLSESIGKVESPYRVDITLGLNESSRSRDFSGADLGSLRASDTSNASDSRHEVSDVCAQGRSTVVLFSGIATLALLGQVRPRPARSLSNRTKSASLASVKPGRIGNIRSVSASFVNHIRLPGNMLGVPKTVQLDCSDKIYVLYSDGSVLVVMTNIAHDPVFKQLPGLFSQFSVSVAGPSSWIGIDLEHPLDIVMGHSAGQAKRGSVNPPLVIARKTLEESTSDDPLVRAKSRDVQVLAISESEGVVKIGDNIYDARAIGTDAFLTFLAKPSCPTINFRLGLSSGAFTCLYLIRLP